MSLTEFVLQLLIAVLGPILSALALTWLQKFFDHKD